MPPIQPSLRGSLLTGASALAMSVSSGAHGQTPPNPPSQPVPQTWQIWGEAGQFWGGGGAVNIPSLPGLGAPFTSFNGQHGFEFAVGADYRPQGQPYHYVFDFRYGRTNTANRNSASSSTFFSGYATTIVTNSATQTSKWESHLAADLMIGRDLGIGAGTAELLFGVRIADLHANAQASNQSSSTTTFYSSIVNQSSSSSSARWNSRFFGAGPRVAVTGSVPIQGLWSFDYGGGLAGLIGDRSFDVATWNNGIPGFAANYGGTAFVFNADASAAFSFIFTKSFKWSIGLHADYYNSPLKTYDISTGGIASLSRVYWGPFMRFTGSF
jgi:hypothetical protein